MLPIPNSITDFNTASMLVVGDVMLDRYWSGEASRISPEAPVPIIKIENQDHRPGGAANVALNIAALAAKVTLLGTVGQDEAGHVLKQQLKAASVFPDFLSLKNVNTIIKLRILSQHQQLLRLDFEQAQLKVNHQTLLMRFKKHLPKANVVILSDYRKGTLTHPQAFIALANQAKIPVLVDPKGKDFSIYQHATLLTPNLREFEAIVGPCHNEKILVQKGRQFLKKYHIASLLITRGEDGMTLIEAHQVNHLPAYTHEVFDVTGAGDTVIAVLGTALASGMALSPATAIANLAASLVVRKLGAASISMAELQAAANGKSNYTTGIIQRDELFQAVKTARSRGKKIIFTNGCFDILHAGHVAYLQMAKQLGDYLIVAINTDESIKRIKGANRPINPLEHRMRIVAGLGVVDWVVPLQDDTPESLLKQLKPDFLVKGADYQLDKVVGAEIVRAYGGKVQVINPAISTSSSAIVDKIQNLKLGGHT